MTNITYVGMDVHTTNLPPSQVFMSAFRPEVDTDCKLPSRHIAVPFQYS